MSTGGPALPVPDSHHANGQVQHGSDGMTLLDWFAGQALQGRAHRFDNPHERRDLLAQDCYDIASSMLAEKARREAVVKASQTTDHSGDANKMVEDHFRDAAKMTKLERQNAQLLSLLRQAELAIAFANREPNVIRMLGDDYTEVLQLVRAALKEAKP